MQISTILLLLGIFFHITLFAQNSTKTQTIKTNGQLIYNQQKKVTTLKDFFLEGNLYGRLRNNTFYFIYNHDDTTHETHLISALGASFVYRSALLDGFGMTLGLYGTRAFFNENSLNNVSHLKAGKDSLSRSEYINNGSNSLTAVGQANINYLFSKTNFILGRQLVETFYTKSNDTKMIPNTFDGLVIKTQDIPKTKLTFAYLVKQKLRDHKSSHSLLMVGDANSSTSLKPEWTENDDSAMHKGLTYSALNAAGKPTNASLIILDLQNNSIDNLKINFSSYLVPQLLSQGMLELNYDIKYKGVKVTPAIRYIQQFDNGAGSVGGASIALKGLNGYKNKSSLNAGMIAAKIVTKIDDYKLNIAYTGVVNKADLVTPWRGFPTSGYTRSMGMYNWRANMKSYRIELVKGANSSGVYKKPFIQTSVLYMNGDKNKEDLDSMFYYAGVVQNIPSILALQYRLRLGYRDFVGDSSGVSDYLDARLEFNYLF